MMPGGMMAHARWWRNSTVTRYAVIVFNITSSKADAILKQREVHVIVK